MAIKMDSIDRVKLLKDYESLENKDLTRLSGSKKDYWKNALQRKQKMYIEELEKLAEHFPEYRTWLLSGIEIPNEGHISPMTKKAQTSLKPTPKAG